MTLAASPAVRIPQPELRFISTRSSRIDVPELKIGEPTASFAQAPYKLPKVGPFPYYDSETGRTQPAPAAITNFQFHTQQFPTQAAAPEARNHAL